MKDLIKVYCVNTGTATEVEFGTSLGEICRLMKVEGGYPYLAAYVNNALKEMNYRVYRPVDIQYVDMTHFEGFRVYQRTATFVMQAASQMVFPGAKFYAKSTLGSGIYCYIGGKQRVSEDECKALKSAFAKIVADGVAISKQSRRTEDVIEIFHEKGMEDKVAFLKSRNRLYSNLYTMGDSVGYFFGALAPSAALITRFDIVPYHDGFLLMLPSRSNPEVIPQHKELSQMFTVYKEVGKWIDVMGVPNVGKLNEKILSGMAGELIKTSEVFHELWLQNIASQIDKAHKTKGTNVVLLSGPSSSGKTTTANRVCIALKVFGYTPVLISLDDYFVDRDKTPKDENGDYDYEALEAVDVKQLNQDLNRLIRGESVVIPKYDFISGSRKWHDKPLKLDERSIIVMEGIHGLNPGLTPDIEESRKFRIYASCFTTVAFDDVSRIPTTDNRLLRRITRDYFTRGCSAAQTIARWPSVRRGEQKWIFPYQENADVMFNSSLLYEISVLKPIVTPILQQVTDAQPEYGEARRLLKMLENFEAVPTTEIPPTSVAREFVGGSSFEY